MADIASVSPKSFAKPPRPATSAVTAAPVAPDETAAKASGEEGSSEVPEPIACCKRLEKVKQRSNLGAEGLGRTAFLSRTVESGAQGSQGEKMR